MPATWALTGVWGFQNVKEEDAKTAKTWKGNLKFLFWSVLGLLGGAILQFIGYMTCLRWSGWNINILSINFSTLFQQDILTFWAFTTVFVVKTAFTMVWNFVTRKISIVHQKKTRPLEPRFLVNIDFFDVVKLQFAVRRGVGVTADHVLNHVFGNPFLHGSFLITN